MSTNSTRLKFSHLRLRNWKNFSTTDVSIQDRMFLVGPNASGKSNLLDAFRFLRDLASPDGGLQEAIRRRGGVKAIRCLAARRKNDVEIHVDLQEANGGARWKYELAFRQDKQRRPLVRLERVLRNDQKIVCRPDKEDREDQGRLTQTALEQVSVNRPFRDVAMFFASTRYSHIVPQLVRDRDRYVGKSKDPYGGDFLEQIAKIPESKREKRMKRIEKALRIAVPQLEEIELWHDDHGAPRLRGKYRHWRPPGAWQTEERFSDGTLRLIGFLWVAMEPGKGPLLLEEPELSLHADIVRISSFGIQNDGKSLHHRYHSNSSRMVNTSNWRLRAKKIFTLSSNAVMRVSAQHPKASPSSSSVSEIIARNRCHSRPAKLNAFNRSCISARTSPMRALSHSNFA